MTPVCHVRPPGGKGLAPLRHPALARTRQTERAASAMGVDRWTSSMTQALADQRLGFVTASRGHFEGEARLPVRWHGGAPAVFSADAVVHAGRGVHDVMQRQLDRRFHGAGWAPGSARRHASLRQCGADAAHRLRSQDRSFFVGTERGVGHQYGAGASRYDLLRSSILERGSCSPTHYRYPPTTRGGNTRLRAALSVRPFATRNASTEGENVSTNFTGTGIFAGAALVKLRGRSRGAGGVAEVQPATLLGRASMLAPPRALLLDFGKLPDAHLHEPGKTATLVVLESSRDESRMKAAIDWLAENVRRGAKGVVVPNALHVREPILDHAMSHDVRILTGPQPGEQVWTHGQAIAPNST